MAPRNKYSKASDLKPNGTVNARRYRQRLIIRHGRKKTNLSPRHNSDDSVIIAKYMKGFEYDPQKKATVLAYYNDLEKKTFTNL